MKRVIDLLAPAGILILVGAQAFVRMGKTLPGKPEAYWIAGAALILLHLILRGQDIARAIGGRQLRYGSNTIVLVLTVTGILGVANYLAFRHTQRWDLTKGQRYSLSPQTKKIVEGLKEDVKITYFQRQPNLPVGQEHLKEFEALSPRLKVDFVDPVANPAKARDYDVKGPWPMLVVERAANRERINNDSEQDLVNALIKVTRDKKKTVCFAEGEGERDIDDTAEQGFSGAKAALNKSQYETKKVLVARDKIPETCTVLVMAGPEKDPIAPVIDSIRTFVKGGGKALLMVEPEMKTAYPNLVALLKEWNIVLGNDLVLDSSGMGQLFGTGPLTPLVAQYPPHEITRGFRVMTAFHVARSAQAGKATIEGVTAQNLAETSPQSWAESDLKLKEPVQYDEGKDTKGPVSLGVAATIRAPEPKPSPSPSGASPSPTTDAKAEEKKEEPRAEGRVAGFGDSDFASNALLSFQGNQDFFLNTVAWLAQDADLISIRPKEPEDQRLFLTVTQQENVYYLALILLPGVFVVLGVATWWRRR